MYKRQVLSEGMLYDYVKRGMKKEEAEKYLKSKEGFKQREYILFAQEKYSNGETSMQYFDCLLYTSHEEIIQYREELLLFGLTLEVLADRAPKHSDTRKRAVTVAEIASEDKETVEETYLKKKLPIRKVARLSRVTEKIVKGSKEFILSVLIIFVKQFPGLVYWIKGERCHHHVS